MADQQLTSHETVDRAEATTAELVRLAGDQLTRLVRDELQFARMEMSVKARRFGVGAGLFGTAGVVAMYGIGVLIATAVLLLALVLPAWLAALIVAVVLFAVAGVLGLLGRGQIRRGSPATPEQTLNSVKADVQTVTEAVRKRGH
ncbi:MAG: phage holin family protein [Actinobacteria bacterium]|nr:MAG: phage holin family protein [Actinomycetota bacterium]